MVKEIRVARDFNIDEYSNKIFSNSVNQVLWNRGNRFSTCHLLYTIIIRNVELIHSEQFCDIISTQFDIDKVDNLLLGASRLQENNSENVMAKELNDKNMFMTIPVVQLMRNIEKVNNSKTKITSIKDAELFILNHLVNNIDTELNDLIKLIKVDLNKLILGIKSVEYESDDKYNESMNSDINDTNETSNDAELKVNVIKEMLNKKAGSKLDFLYNCADKLDNSVTLSTEEYTEKIKNVMGRKNNSSIVLVGKNGIGKNTIINNFIKEEIKENKVFYGFDSAIFIQDIITPGQVEAKIRNMMQYIKKKNATLVIENISILLSISSGKYTISSTLSKYINEEGVRLLCTASEEEYKVFVESDSFLCNNIQKLVVNEPSVEKTIKMIMTKKKEYETYHNVNISKNSINSAVKLSERYIKNLSMPDKAFRVIDQACSYCKLHNCKDVTDTIIRKVISDMTGIELEELNLSDIEKLVSLEDNIHKSIIGQNNAVDKVVRSIKRAKTGINNPDKPLASFMFVGPTGVGKTELCKVLCKELYGNCKGLIRIDMSELNDSVSINKLIGSAPGYIGYDNGGKLTEDVKNNPNSIILLDEIEKAHPKVFDIFLQILDAGRLTDSKGCTVDFRNTIIVMTSNAIINDKKDNLGFVYNEKENKMGASELMSKLSSTFRPEFLNRIDNIVMFDNLTREDSKNIARLMLNKLAERANSNGVNVSFDESVVELVVEKGYSEKYGARNINRAIQDNIEDVIANIIINTKIKRGYKNIDVYVDENKGVCSRKKLMIA